MDHIDLTEVDDEDPVNPVHLAKRSKPAASAQQTATSATNGELPGAAPNPMNDLLYILHQERAARLRQTSQPLHNAPEQAPPDPPPQTARTASQPSNAALQHRCTVTASTPEADLSEVPGQEGPQGQGQQTRQGSRHQAADSTATACGAPTQPRDPSPDLPPPASAAQRMQVLPGWAAQRHTAWLAQHQQQTGPATTATPELSILSYNVWFEPVAFEQRMEGFGRLLQSLGHPDILLLQEVTHNALLVWNRADWPSRYQWPAMPSPDMAYFTLLAYRKDRVVPDSPGDYAQRQPLQSIMGRDVLSLRCRLKDQGSSWPPLLVAVSHLESPTGRDKASKHLEVRRHQLQQGTALLEDLAQTTGAGAAAAAGRAGHSQQPGANEQAAVDVVWAGDMNWINDMEEPPCLPPGWVDVWPCLRPQDPGLTYNSRLHPMLNARYPGARLDRAFARLHSWQAVRCEMVGTQPLKGVAPVMHKGKVCPVLISDHFGLLLHLKPLAPGHAGRTTGLASADLPAPRAPAGRQGSQGAGSLGAGSLGAAHLAVPRGLGGCQHPQLSGQAGKRVREVLVLDDGDE
ncbi:Endonuclease/exonuclease/phosphatase [Haematococcus lacustris]